VQRSWGAITDFSKAVAPEEEGSAVGINTPQLAQILAKL